MNRSLTVPLDTSAEAARVQLAALRRRSPSERLRMSLEMSASVRGFVAAGVRARHPGYTPREVQSEVVRRMLGDAVPCGVPNSPREDGDMEQTAFLLGMVERLNRLGIPYMIAGSHGASAHGFVRATHDIDVIIAPTREQIQELIASLEERYYANRDAALDAFQRESMFNIIDTGSGWKADLVIRRSRPFSLEEFARRQSIEIQGRQVFVASAEDVILSKLEWAERGESERQLRDAEGVARLQGETLDRNYLQKWAAELGVSRSLEAVLARVDEAEQEP